MTRFIQALLVSLALALACAAPAHAQRVHLGLYFGVPLFYWPGPYYYAPPPYAPYWYAPLPAPAVPPPVVIEREQSYWYYCPGAQAYYPYVRQCPQGWQRVPTVPPA